MNVRRSSSIPAAVGRCAKQLPNDGIASRAVVPKVEVDGQFPPRDDVKSFFGKDALNGGLRWFCAPVLGGT